MSPVCWGFGVRMKASKPAAPTSHNHGGSVCPTPSREDRAGMPLGDGIISLPETPRSINPLGWGGFPDCRAVGWVLPRPTPMSPRALVAIPKSIWLRRRGAHLAGQMWLPGGSLRVPTSLSTPFLPTVGQSPPWRGRARVPSCCGAARGGDFSQRKGGSGQPPGWLGAEICFLLVVLSREGGRTIWSSLRQPNKPGNAGQALQIPLIDVGQSRQPGLNPCVSPNPAGGGGARAAAPQGGCWRPGQGLGTAQGVLSCRVFLPSTLLSISSPFCCPKSFSAATPWHGAGLRAWCWALCVMPGLGATPTVPLQRAQHRLMVPLGAARSRSLGGFLCEMIKSFPKHGIFFKERK